MNVGRQIEAAMKALNPHRHNAWWWKLRRPPEPEIQKYIDFLNVYLRERYTEENLTQFTYDLLLRLFAWEARIENATRSISSRALPYVKEGGLVFDIGANVGQFALHLWKKKKARVTLFEPVPLYRDYCRLVTANLPSATVVGKALSDTVGTATLFVDHSNLGWNTLVGEKQTEGMRAITVETTTLDAYIREAGPGGGGRY